MTEQQVSHPALVSPYLWGIGIEQGLSFDGVVVHTGSPGVPAAM
ncbi:MULTISPECIES: hypothetical protein [unclassified Nocardia]|nr:MULTISPECIES: hypothetical protein [unclassified Nocardia]